MGLKASVIQERAENISPKSYDVISARAFAPLDELFAYSEPFWAKDTLAIFPKGARFEQEIAKAQKCYDFKYTAKPSQTSDEAKVLLIHGLVRLDTDNKNRKRLAEKEAGK